MTSGSKSVFGQNDVIVSVRSVADWPDMVNSRGIQQAESGMSNRMDEDWVRGRASSARLLLGTAEEIRLIASIWVSSYGY